MKMSKSMQLHCIVVAATILATTQFTTTRTCAQAPEARRARLRTSEIDTERSRVYVFVEKTGFGHQHGVVGRLKGGYLRVARESAGKLLFDLASFRADTQEARRQVGLEGTSSEDEQQQVTDNMQGAGVLDVAQFPTALFTVKTVRLFEQRGGPKQYSLDGDFALHGVTRAVNIRATGEEEQGYLHLKGSFPLRQTDYGIRPFKKALGAVGVADVLTVYGDLWIKQ